MNSVTLVTAHQANYLPYLGFFEKILVSDRYILVDDTQFVKRGPFGWIHRNRILSPNGPQWLSVPIKTQGKYDQTIAEAEIDQQTNWSRKHLRAIELSYRKAKFFDDIFPELKEIYQQRWTHLVDLSEALILWVLKTLDLQCPVERSSRYQIQGQGSNYVLELAQKGGATHYLSGVHGRDYLDLKTFEEAEMGLLFQDFTCHPYEQVYGKEFTSHLCILDVLFCMGKKGTLDLLHKGSHTERPS
jgi:hypothetical protein